MILYCRRNRYHNPISNLWLVKCYKTRKKYIIRLMWFAEYTTTILIFSICCHCLQFTNSMDSFVMYGFLWDKFWHNYALITSVQTSGKANWLLSLKTSAHHLSGNRVRPFHLGPLNNSFVTSKGGKADLHNFEHVSCSMSFLLCHLRSHVCSNDNGVVLIVIDWRLTKVRG